VAMSFKNIENFSLNKNMAAMQGLFRRLNIAIRSCFPAFLRVIENTTYEVAKTTPIYLP
jgi:hypothetical protein